MVSSKQFVRLNMRNWFKNLDRQTMGIILALAWPTMMEQLMQTAV